MTLKLIHLEGPNISILRMGKEQNRWHIMGCCIALDDTSSIKDFVTTISRRPIGSKLLVAGDFNVNLENP